MPALLDVRFFFFGAGKSTAMNYLHFLPNQSMKEREDGGGEPSRSRFLGRPRLQGHEVLSVIPGVHVGPEDRKGAHGVPLEPLLQEAKVELVRPL